MFEEEFFVVLAIALALGWMVRLVWVNRKLKKQIAALESRPAAAAAPQAAPQQPQRSPEVEELRQRIQVLERIVTDGSPTLDREIEALRRTG